jgi:hypothetical protein
MFMQTISPIRENTEKSAQVLKMPVPKCAKCNDKVALVSGVVICGDKWYHSSCWKPRNESDWSA